MGNKEWRLCPIDRSLNRSLVRSLTRMLLGLFSRFNLAGRPFGPFDYTITRPATQVFNNSEHGYAIIYRAEAFTEFWNEKRLIQDKLQWVVYAAPKLNLTDYPTQGLNWGDRVSAPATVSIQNDFTCEPGPGTLAPLPRARALMISRPMQSLRAGV